MDDVVVVGFVVTTSEETCGAQKKSSQLRPEMPLTTPLFVSVEIEVDSKATHNAQFGGVNRAFLMLT